MIRNLIINRINKIKSDEENFKSYWWKEIFVTYHQLERKTPLDSHIPANICEEYTKHISEVNFDDNIIDDDLVSLFEYIILTRNEISNKKIDKEYFSKYTLKSNL